MCIDRLLPMQAKELCNHSTHTLYSHYITFFSKNTLQTSVLGIESLAQILERLWRSKICMNIKYNNNYFTDEISSSGQYFVTLKQYFIAANLKH